MISTKTVRSRKNNNAQEAYKNQDGAKSREVHETKREDRKIDDEPHKSNSFKKGSVKYLKSCISFGSYGILFCIAIVIGLEAFFYKIGQFDQSIMNINNINNNINNQNQNYFNMFNRILGEGWNEGGRDWNLVVVYITTVIITGTGVALSLIEMTNKKTDIDFYYSEKKRETWEYDNYIEGEQREMIELYCKKGMQENDATVVVELLSKYKDLFVDIMMAEELNLLPVELHLSPIETGLSTLLSFIIFGLIPLIPFIASHYVFETLQKNIIFPLFIVIVESLLFLFGALRSKYFTGVWWKEGLITSVNGIVSIIGSLTVGYFLGHLGTYY